MDYDVNVKPANNLGWGIAGIILFFPTGIPALIRACKVDAAWNRGDKELAWQLSEGAARLGRISLTLGIVFSVCYFCLCFCVGFLEASHHHSYLY